RASGSQLSQAPILGQTPARKPGGAVAATFRGRLGLMRGLFGVGVLLTAAGALASNSTVPPALAPNQPARTVRKVTMDECVAIALEGSGQVMEARGKVT